MLLNDYDVDNVVGCSIQSRAVGWSTQSVNDKTCTVPAQHYRSFYMNASAFFL
jgi:hypothetical protein